MKISRLLVAGFIILSAAAFNLAAAAPGVGSPDTAVADPPVPRPDGSPTVVTLFSDMEFADWNIKDFDYQPPAECPGPWEKVVLTGDFRVTEGVQYDRTCQVTMGFVNIYYGTTPEPSPDFGPTWHFERDLTDYSALFSSPQSGQAILGNIVNDTYTGIIYGTLRLEFYSGASSKKLPEVPDAVLPLRESGGGAAFLYTYEDALSRAFELPRNVEKAYLDVFAQAQHDDEFWFTCVPDDVSDLLYSCGATPFREAEVTLDGVPAGISSVYPWTYTGCIDPYLWGPIPGVQTINFVPYRVDLTPFAALLSDGRPHTVAVRLYNANDYFLADAALLLFQDEGSAQVTGEVTENTLSSVPAPVIVEDLDETDESITGTVSVTSARDYTIAGYVRTSHGKIKTKVRSKVNFSNVQDFTIDNDNYIQDIKQNTVISTQTTTKKGSSVRENLSGLEFPFNMLIAQVRQTTGKIWLTVTVDQQYNKSDTLKVNGNRNSSGKSWNQMKSTDTLIFNSFGNFVGHQDQRSSQHYKAKGPKGYCWDRYIESEDGIVTVITDGCK